MVHILSFKLVCVAALGCKRAPQSAPQLVGPRSSAHLFVDRIEAGSAAWKRPVLLRLLGVQQAFEFRQDPQILFPARGALGSDQARQVEGPDLAVEGLNQFGMRFDLIEAANARDLRQQIDGPEVGREREYGSVAKVTSSWTKGRFAGRPRGRGFQGASAPARRFRLAAGREKQRSRSLVCELPCKMADQRPIITK